MNKIISFALILTGIIGTGSVSARDINKDDLKWSFRESSVNSIQVPISNDRKSLVRFTHFNSGNTAFSIYVSTECKMKNGVEHIVLVNYQKIKFNKECNTEKFVQLQTLSPNAVDFIAKELKNNKNVEIIIPMTDSKVTFEITGNNFNQEYKKFERLSSEVL
ncbi:hypothetical protein QUN99_003375 [Vibrio parahaemolyticus]|nr:hypothetical protein [Vibrio parahaemolyticus]